MSKMTPSELIQKCAQACLQGADFPTVWHTVLKGSPLVAGIPRQRFEGTRSLLDVPLVTGHSLVYDGDRQEFSLQWVPADTVASRHTSGRL
jgi:hypothetical protein